MEPVLDDIDFNWGINMSVVVIYAVLWVIIPRANTVKQKLEMMGEEEYIKSIRETVSDNVASVKSRTDETPGKVAVGSMPPEPPKQRVAKSASNGAVVGSGSGGV